MDDLTIDVIQRAFGNIIPKEAIFQKFSDLRRYEKFRMTIEITKADIEMVQKVRIFYALAMDTSLVQNEENRSEIHKMHMKSKLIEGALIDPYNYYTIGKLRAEDFFPQCGFEQADVEQILKYFKTIISVTSFCWFLKELNTRTILPFPNADGQDHSNVSTANFSQNDADASNVTEQTPLLISSGVYREP